MAEGELSLNDDKLEEWSASSLRQNLRGICSVDQCLFHELCLGGCRATATAFARKRGISDDVYSPVDFCVTHEIQKALFKAKQRRT